MDIKTAYEIRFAFQVKSEKDNKPTTKTYTKDIIAKNVDIAIDWGKDYILNKYSNLYLRMNYIGCAILKRKQIYILN